MHLHVSVFYRITHFIQYHYIEGKENIFRLDFINIFREMLRHIYTLTHSGYTLNVPLERIIANFVIDVPLPIPVRTEIDK
jgi:hypothetical protein